MDEWRDPAIEETELDGVQGRLPESLFVDTLDDDGSVWLAKRALVSAAVAICALTLRRSTSAMCDFFSVFFTKPVITTLHLISTSSRM